MPDDALPANPLPACPSGTWNCVRRSRSYEGRTPDQLVPPIEDALLAMQPEELDMRGEDAGRIHAVFRVLIFRDDVHLAVEAHADGTALHVRSASRTGRFDFGVNRRRAKRFFRLLEDEL